MFSSISCRNSRLMRNYFCKKDSVIHLKTFPRNIALFEKRSPKPVLLDKSQYKVVYKFPFIALVGAVVKCKIWVPGVGVAISPILYIFDNTGLSSIVTILSAGVYFLFGIAVSKIARNIVGKMYVKKDGDISEVMISSIDDYGRRVDRIHKLDDIMNLDYISKVSRCTGFIRLAIENSETFYDLNIRRNSSKFIDRRACEIILGEAPLLSETKASQNLLENPKKQLQS